MRTLILSSILRVLTPLFISFALYMFFRGHNKPGGGFIAGLIASIPFMLHAMVFGYKRTTRVYRIKPQLLAALGLLLALVSGMFSVVMGDPYLTSIWVEEKLPFVGKIGTPIFFDFGVLLVVFGVVLKITFLLTEE
ncbi:MAG TPA: MnhB domain-containing protein [Saprospiraceae bacterium]|nr:MnhB domain-containing protein [Saprospiraceae bacterium]